jgi:hypothetical protein
MRPRHCLFVLLVVTLAGLALVGDKPGRPALAQHTQAPQPPQNPQLSVNGRYQIAVWAIESPPTRSGCYMVDTATGDLWELTLNGSESRWVRKANGPR